MPGKRTKNVTNPQAFEAWKRRKREINAADTQHHQFQKMYRRDCLKARAAAGKLTEKNKAEMARLGF
jgi:hypothetical protein